jgi:Na+-transporting NADH:ubiquinone oxidoreductase subunit A
VAVHRIRKGLDLPLAGEPEQVVHLARRVSRVALLGADYPGLKPVLRVQVGERVVRGQPLFEDGKNAAVRFTAPRAGSIAAIHRGERRVLQSVVIELDPAEQAGGEALQVRFESFGGKPPERLSGAEIKALLLESGMWTAFRTRPFSRIPSPASPPHSIFVTAIDTQPHAPSVEVVLDGRQGDFAVGLRALEALTPGSVFLCRAPGAKIELPPGSRATVEEFRGPHPAGTPGLHIHLLDPVHLDKMVWHIGYQDVAAIGRLLATGKLDLERVVSLAGPTVARPRLLRTRLGASLDELTQGELAPGDNRVISGSVFSGRTARGEVEGYLGRYHQQVAALAEGREREFLGWLAPGRDKFSITNAFASAFARHRRFAFTTTTHGSKRPMVPIGTYEEVMPMDIEATYLLRALLTDDMERAEALGCLELDEEDLALCTFVSETKYDYGPMLRAMLDRIQKES